MSAIWLDPYSLMESSAAVDSQSVDSGVSLIRPDTPQLTTHDYRRWQYSPVSSDSPELDCRRLRRKPSIQNLTGRSGDAAFARMPSSIPPPSSIHNLGPHDTHLHQLQRSSTPRLRAYTASPSLSSTITTLQSTPNHTPILRGASFDEQRRTYERRTFEEPVGTKRKYPSVKRARRFPRRQTGEEGSPESGVYKVYAAVFDISGEGGGLSKDSSSQPIPIGKQDRAVRFGETDIRHEYDISSTPSSDQSLHRRDQTVTSSFSLSKFEFPAPPNQDNWTGATNHLPKSPSATVLYRGASFDLINPHASLLLGKNSVETPAEIDCLLDDYFEDHEDFIVMAPDPDTGEVSQQSLRSVSDSKQTHVLYDDADTARRNILRIPTSIPTEGRAEFIEPQATAVTTPSFVHESTTDNSPVHLPLKRTNTNPFRNRIVTIGRSLRFNTGAGNRDLAEEGRSLDHTGTYGFSTTTGAHAAQRQGGVKSEHHSIADDDERFSDLSNPFDLTVSEIMNNAERMNIDGVTMRERSALPASVSDPTGRRTALNVEDGSNTHAMSESGGDYELSFINRYDYTRETIPHTGNAPSSIDRSIEHGRGANAFPEENSHGWATPVSPGAQFRSSSLGFRTVEDSDDMLPRPLASRRNGFVQRSDMPSIHREMCIPSTSDVPTSEKTYGETNQLLQITPLNQNLPDLQYDPLTRSYQPWSIGMPGFQYGYEETETSPEGNDDETICPSLDGRPGPVVSLRTGSMALSPSVVQISRNPELHRFSVPSVFRTSSERADRDENNWVDDDDDSAGCTEEVDLDDNGDHCSHSSISETRRQLELTDEPPQVTSTDLRQRLALDSFPNLNNPSPEISPQRERENGQGRDVAGKTSLCAPHTPILISSSEPGNESGRTQTPHRQIDYTSRPTGDVKRALAIMKRKAMVDRLGAGRYMSPGAHTAREFGDMQELERIRVYNPDAMDEATARFRYDRLGRSSPTVVAQTSSPNIAPKPSARNKLKKIQNTSCRQNYDPTSWSPKIPAIGRQEIAHGSFSSRRGLLSPPDPGTNLEFSASEGTFVTIRKKKHRNGSKLDLSRDWDPHGINPTDHALERLRSPLRAETISRNPSNLRSVRIRSGQQDNTAIDGQIELRQFRLRAPDARQGLTDRQLHGRFLTWDNFPNENSPHFNEPRLVSHNEPCQEQMDISLKYQSLSALLPFGALVYGLGGFDWIIARKTQGRITSMDRNQKRYVLTVYAPLQLLGYTTIGFVIGIIIYMHYYNGNDKHG